MRPAVPKTRVLLEAGGVSATDIIMNLFVFFFISFSLLATFDEAGEDEHALPIDLPASTAEDVLVAEPVVVEIAADGALAVDGARIVASDLSAVLATVVSRRPDVDLLFRADRAVPLGTVVSYMDLARAAGATSLSVTTREP